MYLQSVTIRNIRILEEIEIAYEEFPGWHVILGDNGSGKSSLIRSIALGLVGPLQIPALRLNFEEWLRIGQQESIIHLCLAKDDELDKQTGRSAQLKNWYVPNFLQLKLDGGKVILTTNYGNSEQGAVRPERFNWGTGSGWFSVAFGPFRRFSGGNPEWSKVFYSSPKAGAHLSVFGEDVALTEALSWLKELDIEILRARQSGQSPQEQLYIFENLKLFLNQSGLLPQGARLDRIEDQPIFLDGDGNPIPVVQLSDGFRSILSLTFELIRQLIRTYGSKAVFKNIDINCTIDLPGIVLIDEIDAHLHPSWQTRIGTWFTKHFPKLQFIVTTHSPLICRGVTMKKGSIFKLSAPGNDEPSGFVTDLEKEKLISGSILEAYDTNLFGEEAGRNKENKAGLKRLGELNMLSALGQINQEQEKERLHLQTVHAADAPTGF